MFSVKFCRARGAEVSGDSAGPLSWELWQTEEQRGAAPCVGPALRGHSVAPSVTGSAAWPPDLC